MRQRNIAEAAIAACCQPATAQAQNGNVRQSGGDRDETGA
jgi:hypothetical protein